MGIELHEETFEGHPAIRMTTPMWSIVVLPTIGAKVISLVAQATGAEWLWREPGRSLRTPDYGGAFEVYDISGFDECFPGIAAGPYPTAPWQGEQIPDHGELWTRSWSYEILPDGVRTWIDGQHFPYTFERRMTAAENGALVLTYTVTNHHAAPMRYVWAAHPLFAVKPGMVIRLPEGTEVFVDYSKDERLGGLLARHPWPITQDITGKQVDLTAIIGPTHQTADKLYAVDIPEGWGALHDPATGAYLVVTFDRGQIPHLGIWINQGGWPADAPPSFNVALEPCSGYPDRLDIAVERGAAGTLSPTSATTWSFTLHSGHADAFTGIV